jgi:hypothetical protein
MKAQAQLAANGEHAHSEDLTKLLKSVTEGHLNILLGMTGRQMVQEYTQLLMLPLSSMHWTILGTRRTAAQLCEMFLSQIKLMCDSYRRLVFKFCCFPFLMFQLCLHAPGGPEWFTGLRISVNCLGKLSAQRLANGSRISSICT